MELRSIYGTQCDQQDYRVQRTNKGQPFLLRKDVERTSALVQQWNNWKPDFSFRGWSEIESFYGIGVRVYFDFLVHLLVLNCVLSLFPLIGFFVHLGISANVHSFIDFVDVFFASSYSPKLYFPWIGLNAANYVLVLVFPVVYWLLVRWTYSRRGILDPEENLGDPLSSDETIAENLSVSSRSRAFRVLASYALFALLVFGSGLLSSAFTTLDTVIDEQYQVAVTFWGSLGVSVAISILTTLAGTLWQKLCYTLTNFERHNTWTSWRKHNLLKYVVFKLVLVYVVVNVRVFFSVQCPLRELGEQYFVQLLLDLFVGNVAEIVVPSLSSCLLQWWNPQKALARDNRPEFDVAEEYLELIYRQYIVYCGMVSFPFLPALGALANFVEFYVDKYRLYKICQKPPLIVGSTKTLVAGFLGAACALSLLNWGSGIGVMAGFFWCNSLNGTGCEKCNILEGHGGFLGYFFE